jgi:hypothetical protein
VGASTDLAPMMDGLRTDVFKIKYGAVLLQHLFLSSVVLGQLMVTKNINIMMENEDIVYIT